MPQNENDPDLLQEDYDELDVPQSRFSVMTGTLVAVGIAALLVFTGVIWYAYNTGAGTAGQDGPEIVHAEPGAVKVKPEDPGGANFAHQDKTVYDKIDGNEAGIEQLLPGAEEPQDKPRILSPYDNELPEAGQPKVVRITPPTDGGAPAAPAEAPEVSAPEIPDPMGRARPAISEGEKVAAEPAPEVTSAAPAESEGGTAESEPVAPAAPEKIATASPAAGGKGFVLQLGAFRTQEAADAGWKLLAARHAGVLDGLEHYVSPADLGEKGRFFRLQAGPFPERQAANEQCAALKSAGVDCLVAVR